MRIPNEKLNLVTGADAERHHRAHADASVCCRCGVILLPGDPVWLIRGRLYWYYEVICITEDVWSAGCQSCARKEPAEEWPHSGKCPGCSRTVHLLSGKRWSFFCSDRCRNRIHGANHRANHPRRKTPKVIVQCLACGDNFVPKRAGAKTCSSACRQRAYRQRRDVTDSVKDNTVSSLPTSVTH